MGKEIRARAARLALACAIGTALVPAHAAARTFTVDSIKDATDDDAGNEVCLGTYEGTIGGFEFVCSLRAAVQEANAHDGPDVIEVPDGTYRLELVGMGDDLAETGDLDIRDDLTIRPVDPSNAPHGVVVDGNGLDRVFDVPIGVDVVIEGLTIRNGDVDESGGAVRQGGGNSRLELRSCVVQDGDAGLGGGALAAESGDRLALEDCLVTGSRGEAGPGGLWSDGVDTVIRRSTFRFNRGSTGAILFTEGGFGLKRLLLVNSTVSGNDGPAIDWVGPDVQVELYNTTVARNDGIGLAGPETTPDEALLQNSVLAENSGADCTSPVLSGGHNLVETPDGDCTLADPTDTVRVAAKLQALGEYGGATPTHHPQTDSPLVDGGDPAGCRWTDLDDSLLPVAVDQRAVMRPFDGDGDTSAVCDVGAVELLPEPGAALATAAALGALAGLRRRRGPAPPAP